jgi:hypothetical protein
MTMTRRALVGAIPADLATSSLGRAQGMGPNGWPHGRSVSLVVPFMVAGGALPQWGNLSLTGNAHAGKVARPDNGWIESRR